MKRLLILFTALVVISCSSDDSNPAIDPIATLPNSLVGDWSGTFSGDDNGTWSITVSNTGVVTGTGVSTTFQENYEFNGNVALNGQINATVGTADTGATFVGVLNTNGTCSGTWVNQDLGLGGTWSGTKD